MIKGEDVKEDELPFVAYIYVKSDHGGATSCSGSLIDPLWVLTKASCNFDRSGIYSEIGFLGNNKNKLKYMDRVKPDAWHYPPDYKGHTDKTDYTGELALIKLNVPKDIQPIPVVAYSVEELKSKNFYVAGFGITEKDTFGYLQRVEMVYADAEQCKQDGDPYKFTDKVFCAKAFGAFATAEAGPCAWDFGGPFYTIASFGQPILVGVTASGFVKNCELSKHSLIISLAPYTQWIEDTIRQFS